MTELEKAHLKTITEENKLLKIQISISRLFIEQVKVSAIDRELTIRAIKTLKAIR